MAAETRPESQDRDRGHTIETRTKTNDIKVHVWHKSNNMCISNAFQTMHNVVGNDTGSQAVAMIAERTASQHLRGSRDVIGHVTT